MVGRKALQVIVSDTGTYVSSGTFAKASIGHSSIKVVYKEPQDMLDEIERAHAKRMDVVVVFPAGGLTYEAVMKDVAGRYGVSPKYVDVPRARESMAQIKIPGVSPPRIISQSAQHYREGPPPENFSVHQNSPRDVPGDLRAALGSVYRQGTQALKGMVALISGSYGSPKEQPEKDSHRRSRARPVRS